MSQTITVLRTALSERLDKAAAAIELIQACVDNHLVEKDSKRMKSLAATMRKAVADFDAIEASETAYDRLTFTKLAYERLSMIRAERAKKVKARRIRREEMAREREAFLREMAGLRAHAA